MAQKKHHWYRGCRLGRASHESKPYTPALFVEQHKWSPDWYCSDCAKAARLALADVLPATLAKESAPKPSSRCTSQGCGSHAINPGQNGRDDTSDLNLCDVCYWRKRAESATWPKPTPIADFPIDCAVPVYVPNVGWVIGTALGVVWNGSKHVASSVVSTEGYIVRPTHFLDVTMPLPPEVR